MSKPILQDSLVRKIQTMESDIKDLKRSVATGVDTTAGRPAATSVLAGTQFYDTTLHKPIWSDGTNWRDSAGTVV